MGQAQRQVGVQGTGFILGAGLRGNMAWFSPQQAPKKSLVCLPFVKINCPECWPLAGQSGVYLY
ncbi:hypothetical protein BLL52_2577 [Rhodoferax antarcticus ANT.BR]|uniref:Uncharacterized protein n=1 Tax=Rhodoferax antarcticus ANT.BR TaxID=1111071 RepID=A0A1Q8YE90_9BURK|nr:hypothetical protein RA876_06985 [Rhodoferax antarcticus]OLP06346.1 hypothetical protein BLL52_2577 [Rhodoferax antarcticus ANT.BR]